MERVGEQYSLRVEKGRFVDVVDALFTKAQREYSLLSKKDVILDKLRFEAKPFERILRLLLEQANADYALIGDVYYIFEIEQRDVLKKLNTTVRIPLTYVSAKELPNLFPAELLSAQLFRIDAPRNAVILSGSMEEIGPAQEFLRQVDQPIADRQYQVFRLNFLNATKIAALLPPEYRHIEPIIIPESNSFVALMPEDTRQAFASYLELIDKPAGSATVKLKYLKAEDLLKKLPPSIAKEEILETGDPSVVFVRASADKLADFYRELKVLDKPVPQIRYQILVIQYSKGETLGLEQLSDRHHRGLRGHQRLPGQTRQPEPELRHRVRLRAAVRPETLECPAHHQRRAGAGRHGPGRALGPGPGAPQHRDLPLPGGGGRREGQHHLHGRDPGDHLRPDLQGPGLGFRRPDDHHEPEGHRLQARRGLQRHRGAGRYPRPPRTS